ncbi:alpha/beta fold hydrolase [Clavibacter tessellarius]|uniref:Peptidase n=1 Tax=Clavibacter tessellarius TaxID=31965 RepID=A0A225CAG7_9MICO|nr:peptidase [Clavibacter michiganensis subsp. tessellarius]UKF32594.1 alpha/beta fold hydrolase [Clavibacter michiganensis subsp. tessellarius]
MRRGADAGTPPDRVLRASGRRRSARRAAGAVAALVVGVLVLSGCGAFGIPAPRSATSSPSAEEVAPDLARYYGQTLQWSPCEDGAECTTATAPLDWSAPDPATDIQLALVRHTARGSGEPRGSLFVNPGGPGASGVDFVKAGVDSATSRALQDDYDVVGWDPRGVGASTAVDCVDDAQLDALLYQETDAAPGTPQADDELIQASKDFAASCAARSGDLLEFIDTRSTAHDLDMLRALVGDPQLNYLGYSYGTSIGAQYAQDFPAHVGRMVLDGATDPAASAFDVVLAQTTGFRDSFEAYMSACLAASGCPFRGSVDDGIGMVASLLATLDASPVRAADGRELDRAVMRSAIDAALYSEKQWPTLTTAFTRAMQGDPSIAFALADNYFGRNPDGTYRGNYFEAFLAIQCVDHPVERDASVLATEAREIRSAEGELADADTSRDAEPDPICGNWPYAARQAPGPVSAEGAAPIVVVGTTGDPATPYSWAQALAGQLSSGVLLTYRGEGHIAYDERDPCIVAAVDGYLLGGDPPADGTTCG